MAVTCKSCAAKVRQIKKLELEVDRRQSLIVKREKRHDKLNFEIINLNNERETLIKRHREELYFYRRMMQDLYTLGTGTY